MTERLDLDEYRSRARSAANYGKEGFFVDTLIWVADRDVPALCDEIEELRRLNEKLGATIAAFPDAQNAANIAHARAERDDLRAEVKRLREAS